MSYINNNNINLNNEATYFFRGENQISNIPIFDIDDTEIK